MKVVLGIALAASFALSHVALAQGDDYPNRAVRIVVPYNAGGTVDILARKIAQHLSATWSKPALVENRPGAGGNTGTAAVAISPPDGYTLLLATNSPLTTNPALYKNIRYNALRDFEPITIFGESALILIGHKSTPVNGMRDLLALAAKTEAGIQIASSGYGTTGHFLTLIFSKAAGGRIKHIPYPGGQKAGLAVASGEMTFAMTDAGASSPMVRDGTVKGIAISGTRRDPRFPAMESMAEANVPNGALTSWIPIVAPKGTPKPILAKLNTEFQRLVRDAEFKGFMQLLGVTAVDDMGLEKFAGFLEQEVKRWGDLVRETGLSIDN